MAMIWGPLANFWYRIRTKYITPVGGELGIAGTITVDGITLPVVQLSDTPGLYFRDANSTVIAQLYWIANNVTSGTQDTDLVLNIIKAGVHVAVIDTVVETLIAAGAAKTTGPTRLALAGAGAVTLADSAFDEQKKTFVMTVDNGDVTVTVANHEGANDVVFTFTAVNDFLKLEGHAGEWHTIISDLT